MAIDRINAVASAQRVLRRGDEDAGLPGAGETVSLSLEEIDGEHLLATTANGVSLRLTGLSRMTEGLTPGDLLLVRVLATRPALSLSLIDTVIRARSDSAPASMQEPAAMQADQLALRQLVRQVPDASTLASLWRARVLAGLEQQASVDKGRPSAAFIAGLQDAGVTLRQAAPQEQAIPFCWMFPASGWSGPAVLLRLLESDEDEARHPRHPRAAALRLELELPGMGRIMVQVELLAGGVYLTFDIQQDSALRLVRKALPAIAAALASIGLAVRRCKLSRRMAVAANGAGDGAPEAIQHQALWTAAELSPALFRAAAEVALGLSAAT